MLAQLAIFLDVLAIAGQQLGIDNDSVVKYVKLGAEAIRRTDGVNERLVELTASVQLMVDENRPPTVEEWDELELKVEMNAEAFAAWRPNPGADIPEIDNAGGVSS